MSLETDFCFPGLLGIWLTKLPLPNINGFLSAFCCSMAYVVFGTSHHISIGEVYFVLRNVSTGLRDYVQCCFKRLVRCPNLCHLLCRSYLESRPPDSQFVVVPLLQLLCGESFTKSVKFLCTPEDTSDHRHQCKGDGWSVMEVSPM